MKNTIIMGLAFLGVVSFASIGSAENYGRYLGVSYPDSGAPQVSRASNDTVMAPAKTFGRYLGSTYVVPEQSLASSGVAAHADFKTIDRVAGQTLTTINGTVKSINVGQGFLIAQDKVSGQEKLIHVPDAKALAGLNIGDNVSAVLPGASCMALRIK
jgi:hypothetical protein